MSDAVVRTVVTSRHITNLYTGLFAQFVPYSFRQNLGQETTGVLNPTLSLPWATVPVDVNGRYIRIMYVCIHQFPTTTHERNISCVAEVLVMVTNVVRCWPCALM